jgi:hypothetical protein
MVKDPKGRPDTQTYWSTDCRPQEELQLQDSNFKKTKKKKISGQKSQIGLDTKTY